MNNESLNVKKRNGRLQELDTNKINLCVERACDGLEEVSASEVILDAQVQLYDKITTKEKSNLDKTEMKFHSNPFKI